MVAATPGAFMPQQFENPANPEIHRRTTAEEIWNDTEARSTIFVSGRRHRRHDHRRRRSAEAAQAGPQDRRGRAGRIRRCCRAGSAGPHKIQGIGAGFVPAILERELIDEVMTSATRRRSKRPATWRGSKAFRSASRPARRSRRRSKIGARPECAGKNIVIIIPSFAERYLSTALFDNL